MLTEQIYVHVMCEDSFFKLTVKITELCHKILKFSVLCSLISDLCIDLPNAQIGRTGLSVLHTGVGGGAYKRDIDDHSAYSKIAYFGHILGSLAPTVYKLPNYWRKCVIPQR